MRQRKQTGYAMTEIGGNRRACARSRNPQRRPDLTRRRQNPSLKRLAVRLRRSKIASAGSSLH